MTVKKADKHKRSRSWARIAVDVALALLFVVVMATAIIQEVPHEYFGVALFAVVVAHIVLNRRWFKTLFRGRYGTVRIMQLVPIAGLAVCIVGQIASALVLSKYALGFLPALPGASWARRVHMLCSYWSFVFAFAHAGAQFKGFARLARTNMHAMPSVAIWLARALVTTISCYGVYAFVRMGLGAYLLGRVQFAFVDSATPLALACARYAAVAVLVSSLSHCLCSIVGGIARRNRRPKP